VASSSVTPAGETPARRYLARDTSLLIAIGVLILLVVFASFMARFYHQTERSRARNWFAAGEAAMQAGHASTAIQDYRTALVYSRENGDTSGANDVYDLHLAEALAAAGRADEARAYLLALLDHRPGDAVVNLDLARLAARGKAVDVAEASRYYNGAIYGVWNDHPVENRREVRIEYAKFLLEHGQVADAQAQLIAMASSLPNTTAADAPLHTQAGELLFETGAYDHALDEFRKALLLDRSSPEAERGAGLASFQMGNYPDAARFLERAAREGRLDDTARRALDLSRDVLTLDPYLPSLPVAERAYRAASDLAIALRRAQGCAQVVGGRTPLPATDVLAQTLAQAQKISTQGTESYLRAHADNISPVMDLAFSLEDAAATRCGQPAGEDLALRLIARSHSGGGQ
jgi:tetratricopeptide (TPR) repeat protein